MTKISDDNITIFIKPELSDNDYSDCFVCWEKTNKLIKICSNCKYKYCEICIRKLNNKCCICIRNYKMLNVNSYDEFDYFNTELDNINYEPSYSVVLYSFFMTLIIYFCNLFFITLALLIIIKFLFL